MDECDVCRKPSGDRAHWDRIAPPVGSMEICPVCAAGFLERAEDRASEAEDVYRILGLTLRLGGEVWRVGDRSYWYREPLHSLATAHLEPPPELPPSPATQFLYELAGVPLKPGHGNPRSPATSLKRRKIIRHESPPT